MAAFNGKNDDETPWDGYPPVKLTQLWIMAHLYMVYLLRMVIFNSFLYV
jgi:hypothetical protein